MTAAGIARLISGYRYPFQSEIELQAKIGTVLSEAGVLATREVSLSAEDRVDFMAGSIAIEVKIAGSRAAVLRQLHRYAQISQVSALVLVTNRARHVDMPVILNGKELYVASLLGGAF